MRTDDTEHTTDLGREWTPPRLHQLELEQSEKQLFIVEAVTTAGPTSLGPS